MVTLVLLAALATLSLNLFLPSLSNIAHSFQVDYAVATLSIAGYLAVTAVLQLVIGPMSDRFGRRPVLLCGLACFVVGSLGCWLAPREMHSRSTTPGPRQLPPTSGCSPLPN